MKKFLLVLIALGTTLSLTGCLGEEEVVVPQEEEKEVLVEPYIDVYDNTLMKNESGENIITFKYLLKDSDYNVTKITLFYVLGVSVKAEDRLSKNIEIPKINEENEYTLSNVGSGVKCYYYLQYEYSRGGETFTKSSFRNDDYIPKDKPVINEEYEIKNIGSYNVEIDYDITDEDYSLVSAKIELKNLLTQKYNIFEISSSRGNIDHKIDGHNIEFYRYKSIKINNLNSFIDYDIKVSLIYDLYDGEGEVELEVFNDTFKTRVGSPYGLLNTNENTIYEVEKIGAEVPEFQYSYSDRGSIVSRYGYDFGEIDSDGNGVSTGRELTVVVAEAEGHEKINTLYLGGVEKGKTYRLIIYLYFDKSEIPGSDGLKYFYLTIEII